MPGEQPRARGPRRTGSATTRSAIRRENRRPRTEPDEPDEAQETAGKDRWRLLRAPVAWLVTVVVAAAALTFQDVLVSTAKTVLPVEALPDALSPRDAVEVVEARDVKQHGEYLVRGGSGAELRTALNSGEWREETEGVVDVNRSEYMVTLRGQASQQVRITDIVPEVEGGECSAPLGGRLVYAPSQGGDEVIPLEVDIDDRSPRLEAYRKDRPYFTGPKGTHILLRQNETEAFFIIAKSRGPYCRWRYRMHYEVGGETREQMIARPDGKPFELTGERRDTGDYATVHYPSFTCPVGEKSGHWSSTTGEKYARAKRGGKGEVCP